MKTTINYFDGNHMKISTILKSLCFSLLVLFVETSFAKKIVLNYPSPPTIESATFIRGYSLLKDKGEPIKITSECEGCPEKLLMSPQSSVFSANDRLMDFNSLKFNTTYRTRYISYDSESLNIYTIQLAE